MSDVSVQKARPRKGDFQIASTVAKRRSLIFGLRLTLNPPQADQRRPLANTFGEASAAVEPYPLSSAYPGTRASKAERKKLPHLQQRTPSRKEVLIPTPLPG